MSYNGKHTQRFSLSDARRFYSWRIVTYCDINLFINDLIPLCNHYCYIYHDKDNADSHYHLLITFKREISAKKLISLFPTYQNTFVEPTNKEELKGDFLYLTHSNANDKYQYSIDNVISNNIDYYLTLTNVEKKELKNDDLYEDIVHSEWNPRRLVQKYGRDFIINYNRYSEFREIALFFENGVIPSKKHTRDILGIPEKLNNDNIKM